MGYSDTVKTDDINSLKMGKRLRSKFKIGSNKFYLLLFSVVAIAALFEPTYISRITSLHWLFVILRYAVSAIVIVMFFAQKIKLNSFLVYTMVFEGLLFLSTFISSQSGGSASISAWIDDSAYSIIFVLFMQIIFDIDPALLVNSLSIVLGSYVNINMLCRFMYPGGMYVNSIGYSECWFLGYDNVAVVIILFAEIISLYRIVSNEEKLMLWDWSVIIFGTLFVLVQGVGAAIVAEVVFFSFVLFSRNSGFRKKVGNAKLIVSVMFLLFVFIQFFNIQQASIFNNIFSLLGKNASFSGRTYLWQQALSDITGSNFFLGCGVHSSKVYASHFGAIWKVHLHSYYLQVLYEGGAITFLTLYVFILNSATRFNKSFRSFNVSIFLAGLIAVMLMWQVEASSALIRYFFIILFLLYNSAAYERKTNEQKSSKCRVRFTFRSLKI